MTPVNVSIQQLDHGKDLPLPAYATEKSAGMDLCAAIEEDMILEPGERKVIPTGIAIALPDTHEAQIRSRSGMTFKHGMFVLNAPGTIDADYRGEVKVIMCNISDEAYTVTRGTRVAQLVIAPVSQAVWQVTESLDETDRGAGGFGSTGMKIAS